MRKLVGFQFTFQYKKDSKNKATDALSRVRHVFALPTVSSTQPVWIEEIMNSSEIDTHDRQQLHKLAMNPDEESEYSLENGLLKNLGWILVDVNPGLQTKIIEALQSSEVGGGIFWKPSNLRKTSETISVGRD